MNATTRLAITADPGGTAVFRFNALRHGVLSRYTVLPWEDAGEYEGQVEELAGILWRKRRLRLAEAAAYRRGRNDALARLDGGEQVDGGVALVEHSGRP